MADPKYARTGLVFLVQLLIGLRCVEPKDSHQIQRDLIKHIHSHSMDFLPGNGTLRLTVGMALMHFDLDEKTGILTTLVWQRYFWRNIELLWNSSEYGGIDAVRVEANSLWLPDIELSNAVKPTETMVQPKCILRSTGHIMWVPSYVYKTICSVQLDNFPFDTQECKFKLLSWTYGENSLELSLSKNEIDMNLFIQNSAWEIKNRSATIVRSYYPCCTESYPHIEYTLQLSRRSLFYVVLLVIPCVLLVTLTVLIFFLPANGADRVNVGISVFLAYFMLLLIFGQLSSPAVKLPLLGTYVCANMVLTAFSILTSCVTANLILYAEQKRPIPRWVKKVFIYVGWQQMSPPGNYWWKRSRNDVHVVGSGDVSNCEETGLNEEHPGFVHMSGTTETSADQPSQDEEAAELWLLVSRAVDRLSFTVFLICNIGSVVVIFRRP